MSLPTTSVRCNFVVEMVNPDDGYRFWSASMFEWQVDEYISHMESQGYGLSDVDHQGACYGDCSAP